MRFCGRSGMCPSTSRSERPSVSSAGTEPERPRCSRSCRGSPSPPKGDAVLAGRVGSLLEVGTGFHPELTGRENVYLNGAILGMSRTEIARRFDDIVEFAETEAFLDTPVKRYSSGMQVRLAFAVAAHLEPEILIVDEVLAVGDVAFQRKCLGKMGDVATEGRTILFVSHNMSVVSRLCDTGIWLDNGKVAAQGPMEDVVRQYLGSDAGGEARYQAPDLESAPGNDVARLRGVRVLDHLGRNVSSVDARITDLRGDRAFGSATQAAPGRVPAGVRRGHHLVHVPRY